MRELLENFKAELLIWASCCLLFLWGAIGFIVRHNILGAALFLILAVVMGVIGAIDIRKTVTEQQIERKEEKDVG